MYCFSYGRNGTVCTVVLTRESTRTGADGKGKCLRCDAGLDHGGNTSHSPRKSIKSTMRRLSKLLLILAVWFDVASTDSNFDPYAANGGLVSAVAGNGFCIIAADTRMSGSGYLLHSRNHLASRLWTVNDNPIMTQVEETLRGSDGGEDHPPLPVMERLVELSQAPILIGSSGCTADCRALQSDLRADLRVASHFGQTDIQDPNQVATSLSQMLYERRGFPYYAFCVAAALDAKSKTGQVYVYDAIGSYEKVAVATAGTGREALQPILDRMFESSSSSSSSSSYSNCPVVVEGTASSAVRKLYHAYRSVAEREIQVGDKLVLHVSEVVDGGMVKCNVMVFPLKED